ncbi:MAG TPA: nucleotidyltransferase domain-containing protein [Candidatus Bathyarchaeota archaeon]|nr:nucleotidyltransferase domain-containing protein [Candidatus Bathyarchaeota archaeon]
MVHIEAPPGALGHMWNGTPALSIVEDFIGRLSELARVRAVVAIGSRVRGGWRPWSDIDLVIVCDEHIGPHLPKLRHLGTIDPKPYTPKGLLEGILRCDVELVEAFEEGLVLYDDGLWADMRVLYERVKTVLGVEKYGPGWRIRRKVPPEELARAVRRGAEELAR